MQLLERDASLAALAGYAADAARGVGRLVLVAGEAGVGKSALVERFEEQLPAARWSWGACDGLFTPRPLGPLFDVADRLGGPLLRLCQAGAGREELFRELLREIGDPGVVDAIVLEDIHWADEATLDLLRFLGRRLRDAAVLGIVTYRNDGLAPDHPLRVVLGDLASQRSTRRIDLGPLTPGAIRTLAGGTELEASELHRLTGGNPFYVTEVLRAGVGTVPASARDAVLARVARLDNAAREALEAAALTGTRVELRLLAAMTHCPPPVVDRLLACGLVVADGEALAFRHELARLAVAGGVPAHRVRAVHAGVLAALAELGHRDDARMAFHAEAAGDAAAVLRHAPAAARQAARLASHREATAQFERALRFAAGADGTTLAELNEELADELALLDRWAEAARACEHALAHWRAIGDRRREGAALRRISRAKWNLCRGDEAVVEADAAVSVLEPLGPGVELAWAYATAANQRMLCSDNEAAIGLAARAMAMATRLGAGDVLSDALNTQAVSVWSAGGEGTVLLERALEIALAGRHHEQAGRAYSNLCGIHSDDRRFAEAERYAAEGIAYCDEHDLTAWATCLWGERAGALERTGRWARSLELSRWLLETAGPSPANRLCGLRRIAGIQARTSGPAESVWAGLDEAIGTAARTGEPQQIVAVRLARAEAYWLEGRRAEAGREADLAADVSAGRNGWERGAVAAWQLRTGSTPRTHGEVAEPYRWELDGEPAEAARAWTELGCRYEAGLVLAATGDERTLREALAIFTELGAIPAARIVRRELRGRGVRSLPAGPRSATREHPLGLTRREREVLTLICARLTNAEIAAKLFISTKTVDHHVSAVLAKLGVPSRSAAADRAVRLGMAQGKPEGDVASSLGVEPSGAGGG